VIHCWYLHIRDSLAVDKKQESELWNHGCQLSESMLGDFEEPIAVPTIKQAVRTIP